MSRTKSKRTHQIKKTDQYPRQTKIQRSTRNQKGRPISGTNKIQTIDPLKKNRPNIKGTDKNQKHTDLKMTGQNHNQHLPCFPAFDRKVYDHLAREEVSRTGEGQGRIKKYKDNAPSLKIEG